MTRLAKVRPIQLGSRRAKPKWPDHEPGLSEFEKTRREVFGE